MQRFIIENITIQRYIHLRSLIVKIRVFETLKLTPLISGHVAQQAITWFMPEIRRNPNFLNNFLEVYKSTVEKTENILFLEDLPALMRPMGNSNSSPAQTLSLHGASTQVKSVALYAFEYPTDAHVGGHIGWKVRHLIDILYCLEDLQKVYLVLDLARNSTVTPFKKPRFVNGTSSFINMQHSDSLDLNKRHTYKMQLDAAIAYQHAAKLKSAISEGISLRNSPPPGAPDIPKREFEIKVVQWEKDD